MKTKDIGYVGLGVGALMCILMTWLMYATPPSKSVVINLDNIFPCINDGSDWVETTYFTVDQTIYVCTDITSNDSDLHDQLIVRVFEGQRTFLEHEIFWDLVNISNGKETIRVDTYLFPGYYEITLSYGRKTISSVQIEIVD